MFTLRDRIRVLAVPITSVLPTLHDDRLDAQITRHRRFAGQRKSDPTLGRRKLLPGQYATEPVDGVDSQQCVFADWSGDIDLAPDWIAGLSGLPFERDFRNPQFSGHVETLDRPARDSLVVPGNGVDPIGPRRQRRQPQLPFSF